jgi:hypothetical protein
VHLFALETQESVKRSWHMNINTVLYLQWKIHIFKIQSQTRLCACVHSSTVAMIFYILVSKMRLSDICAANLIYSINTDLNDELITSICWRALIADFLRWKCRKFLQIIHVCVAGFQNSRMPLSTFLARQIFNECAHAFTLRHTLQACASCISYCPIVSHNRTL